MQSSELNAFQISLARHWKQIFFVLSFLPAVIWIVNYLIFPSLLPSIPLIAVYVSLGVLLLVTALLLRFPTIDIAITRGLLPPYVTPPKNRKSPVFIGPQSYTQTEKDRFHGRSNEIKRCLTSVRSSPFSLLRGESGVGKTSFLRAGILPSLEREYRVVLVNLAHDPFQEVYAALVGSEAFEEPVTEQKLLEILSVPAQGYSTKSFPQPLLLILDSCETLLTTVPKEESRRFLQCLKEIVQQRYGHLLLSLREDFAEPFTRLCYEIDPVGESLRPDTSLTLEAFTVERTTEILRHLLPPPTRLEDKPGSWRGIEDFAATLSSALLRENSQTVLPVELQTIGSLLEEERKPLPLMERLKTEGKESLLRDLIEQVIEHVFWKTGVRSCDSLRILNSFLPQENRLRTQTPKEIAIALDLPVATVIDALNVFIERSLLVRYSSATEAEASQYRLLHEYQGYLIEQFQNKNATWRFWQAKASRAFSASATPQPALRQYLSSFFLQPIPLGESLRLWSLAPSTDRWLLKRNNAGFLRKVAAVLLLIVLPLSALVAYTRTDAFQVQWILWMAPEKSLAADKQSSGDGALARWAIALALSGHLDRAFEVAERVKDPNAQLHIYAAFLMYLSDTHQDTRIKAVLDGIRTASVQVPGWQLAPVFDAMVSTGHLKEAIETINARNTVDKQQTFVYLSSSLEKAGNPAGAQLLRDMSGIQVSIEKLITDRKFTLAKKRISSLTNKTYGQRLLGMLTAEETKARQEATDKKPLPSDNSPSPHTYTFYPPTGITPDLALMSRQGIEEAKARARQIQDPFQRLEQIITIAQFSKEEGENKDIKEIAPQVVQLAKTKNNSLRAFNVTNTATLLVEMEQWDAARNLIEVISAPDIKLEIQLKLANREIDAGQLEQARKTAQEAKKLGNTVLQKYPQLAPRMLSSMAQIFARLHDFQQARAFADAGILGGYTCPDGYRISTYSVILKEYAQSQMPQRNLDKYFQ